MIDIHTHILPGMDDGSRNVEMSLEMLRRQMDQGVDTVVLTPHCYRDKERLDSFLARRAAAYMRLQEGLEQTQMEVPRLILGAEVAWAPGMPDWPELEELCFQGTSNLLLEMPFRPWQDEMIHQIYEMMDQRGIMPIFAHLERYIKDQRPEHIEEILSMGTPIQVSAAPLLSWKTRRPIMKMLKKGQAHLLASDCHNLTTRPPCLAAGLEVAGRAMGEDARFLLDRNARRLVKQTAETR